MYFDLVKVYLKVIYFTFSFAPAERGLSHLKRHQLSDHLKVVNN